MPLPDSKPLLRRAKLQKAQHIIIIIKRLSDAHEHNAVDPLAKVPRGNDDLPEHFSRAKIAHFSAERRSTEAAAHAAADLRGDTDRCAVMIAHHNAFDMLSVEKLIHIFHRAVHAADKLLRDTRIAQRRRLGKAAAQSEGQIGHFFI